MEPSREKTRQKGEGEAELLHVGRADSGSPLSRARDIRASFPCLGLLRPVPLSGPGCEQPSDPSAVHVPGPDPAHRVVGRLPLHPVCHVQAGAGAGVVFGAARVALPNRRGVGRAGGFLLEPRWAPHPQHN